MISIKLVNYYSLVLSYITLLSKWLNLNNVKVIM
jgi:hypothetical protein